METAKRLKEIRSKTGLSQTEFGKLFGLTRDTICSYEIGRKTPSVKVLETISSYFNLSIDYILGKTDTPTESEEDRADREISSRSAADDFSDLFPQASFDTSRLLFQALNGCTEEELQKAAEMIRLLRR